MTSNQLKIIALTMLLINSGVAWTASCAEYPYAIGLTVEPPSGDKWRILSTYSVRIYLDDISENSDMGSAKDNATMNAIIKAKAQIANYMESTVELTPKGKVTSSKIKLKGVYLEADCYTPLKEVRVTVGISSSSIKRATEENTDTNTKENEIKISN